MKAHAEPSAALRAAFLGTVYGPEPERFRLEAAAIPVHPPSWAEASLGGPARSWAVVTAWNPQARAATPQQNRAAQQALHQRVARWPTLASVNGEGEWREDSLVIVGMRLREAARLGEEFGQAAVLWGQGRRVALVWLEPCLRVERFWASPRYTPAS